MKTIFISYAHTDRDLAESLLRELKPNLACSATKPAQIWIDTQIAAGHPWDAAIRQQLQTCDLGLLLVSPAYRCSKYIDAVEQKALLTKAVAVGLKRVDFSTQLSPDLASLQIYRHIRPKAGDTFFSQCSSRQQREAFVHGLFQEIHSRLT